MHALISFFSDFDGPSWSTTALSLAAVAVSVIALLRTRAPAPHWEFVSIKEETRGDEANAYTDQFGDAVYPELRTWSALLRQNGPGDAESVASQVKLPDGTWTEDDRAPTCVTSRGAEIGILLCARVRSPGTYKIRLTYRQLPNTRKLRVWEHDVTLT